MPVVLSAAAEVTVLELVMPTGRLLLVPATEPPPLVRPWHSLQLTAFDTCPWKESDLLQALPEVFASAAWQTTQSLPTTELEPWFIHCTVLVEVLRRCRSYVTLLLLGACGADPGVEDAVGPGVARALVADGAFDSRHPRHRHAADRHRGREQRVVIHGLQIGPGLLHDAGRAHLRMAVEALGGLRQRSRRSSRRQRIVGERSMEYAVRERGDGGAHAGVAMPALGVVGSRGRAGVQLRRDRGRRMEDLVRERRRGRRHARHQVVRPGTVQVGLGDLDELIG